MRAKEHLHRAIRNLQAARSNIDSGFFEVAVNRCYYAALEAARGALLARGLSLPKTHRGLASQFGRYVVKEGLVHEDVGQLLRRLEQDRLVADYEGAIPSSEDVQESLAMAESLVDSVRNALFVEAGDARNG